MRLLFALKEGVAKPVTDSHGYQRIIASLLDDDNQIVAIIDKNTGKFYIEKLINRFAIDQYQSTNFKKIDDVEEWDSYKSFFHMMGIIPDC